jgi:uncharacterized protein
VSLEADLLRPGAYGALQPESVRLVQTHASSVFLLPRDVFKLKRHVDLGFLDFTTLERREAACRAEVLLNARLASDVYLGVVPVRRDQQGRASMCAGSADGPVVDWAVHMRRLPDEQRADMLLATGGLDALAVDAIAVRLARFHASAPSDSGLAALGSPEAIARNVEENFAQTRTAIDAYVPEGATEIVRWQTAFLRGHEALFAQRAASGRVRDGHGDLRLEHVYFECPDEPTIIDCIEFNDRFRFADVCADVAFLSMDLEAHGRVDLAERLLARYARESNDFDLYALVDFYESYRAFVRAKVATFLAADADVDEPARVRAAAEARRHFLLALAAARRSMLLPAVVAVGGIIASGPGDPSWSTRPSAARRCGIWRGSSRSITGCPSASSSAAPIRTSAGLAWWTGRARPVSRTGGSPSSTPSARSSCRSPSFPPTSTSCSTLPAPWRKASRRSGRTWRPGHWASSLDPLATHHD